MRTLVAALACTAALTGCSFSTGPDAIDQAELEKKVAGLYTADDPEADITAECGGDLAAEVDATQECHLVVGEESADVRVVVTEVGEEQLDFEAMPYVPAERVAETVKESLEGQGFQPETVTCDGELKGQLDATTTCTVAPAEGEGKIEVSVTQVDGLMVNFNYEVVA